MRQNSSVKTPDNASQIKFNRIAVWGLLSALFLTRSLIQRAGTVIEFRGAGEKGDSVLART